MKTLICFVLFAAALVRLEAADDSIPTVTATGTAITRVKPDTLRWQLTVSNRGGDLASVSEQHAQLSAAVLRFLSESGVPAADTQTSNMRFSENRQYLKSSWVREGYVASTQVSFSTTNLAAYKELWLGLSRLTGVAVDSVSWDVSNRIALQNSTRVEALTAAKTKASEMAQALGSRIAEPRTIEELGAESPFENRALSNVVREAPGSEPSEDESVAPGMISIRTRVKVSFRLATP
jgi:uncharacterized protein YggE